MSHIAQVSDNVESLTLEWSSTSPLCIFFERHSALDGRAGEICPYLYFLSPSHWCAQWGWQQLCHALPPLQICCLRTALCYNCQLASMVCRLLRSILEGCNIALCFICHLIAFSSSLPFRSIKIQGKEAPCVLSYGTFVQFVQCISEKRSARLGRHNSVL